VPYAPGGLPDTVARIVAQGLQEHLGQPVVVENRPGGNGSIAATALATSKSDGYTFMVTDGSVVSINPHLYTKLTYNPSRDFLPVSYLARAPLFLAVNPNVPVSSFREFIEYVKARPDKLNYGSSGIGSTHHLSMEAVMAALGLKMTHVPYRGSGQSVPALIGGQVEALFSAYPSLAPFVKDGRAKLLATNGAERSPDAPDVPAIAEFIPGFDFATTIGILAPVGTLREPIEKLAAAAATVSKNPEVIKKLALAGIEAVGTGPEDYARALKGESDRVTKTVQTAGIKPED
jgi:tripartite-type tricarboxylate transporter receptor subunit TctC